MTAYHWRTIRLKLALAGITDPMQMRSMHYLLDATEAAVLESMTGSANPEIDQHRREDFIDKLYKPTREAIALNGDGYKPPPPGFENPEDVEASFDAFAMGGKDG